MECRVLIIVQNRPVSFDWWVWLECQALISAGYRVAVVCPKGCGDPAYEVVDAVELYKYQRGPQDGTDIVVRAANIVVNNLGRDDIAFTLIGSGDCFNDLVALRDEFGLAGHAEFTGRAPNELVVRIMSTADAGLSPDPKNPLNDVSTMNKTMEYMAFGLPVVALDLPETRVSAGDAAVYVQPNDEQQYAEAIVALLDDEHRRALMGKVAQERVEQELAWVHQESAYLAGYERVLSQAKARKRTKA